MRLMAAEQLLKDRDLSGFSNASVFGALSESWILWLLENGKIHAIEKGECVFEHGQPGNSFHVILEGRIGYYKFHEGRHAYIRDYNAGEQIGFMSLIALHDRVGTARALDDTITLEIDSELFSLFHSNGPLDFGILMMNLAREMARTLRSVDNIIVDKSQE